MESVRIIGILILAVLCACTRHELPPSSEEDVLYRVECFYQRNPDSALYILENLNLASLSKKERAHYCLLRAKVNNYFRQYDDETDSLLQVAENYFAGGKDKYFEAMTYWVKASAVTPEKRTHQFVLDNRLKALQSIEQCQHVDERLIRYSLVSTDEQHENDRLKFAIHQRLGMAYTGNGYFQEGIGHLKISERYYFEKQQYRLHIASTYMLGDAYLAIKEYDSCLMYYQKGLRSAEMLDDNNECAYYHESIAQYYLYRHEQQAYSNDEESRHLLHQAVKEGMKGLQVLSLEGGNLAEHYRWELQCGLVTAYFGLQQYDSCLYYGQLACDYDMPELSILVTLYHAGKALGDSDIAAYYADLALSAKRDDGSQQKAVAEVKEAYDKQLEFDKLRAEQQLKRYRLYLWMALLVCGVMMLLWFVLRYRKNKELETLRLREERLRLQSDKERMGFQMSENLLKRIRKIYSDLKDDTYSRILNELVQCHLSPSLSQYESGLSRTHRTGV